MKYLLGTGSLALALLLGGCGGDEPVEPEVQIPPGSDTNVTDEEPDGERNNPLAFFMEDGVTAQFKGDGNEFAALTVRTEHPAEDYVALYEDNGGTVMLKVYRLSDDRVDLVKEEPEFYDEYNPTLEELEALETISTYLEFPLEEGNTIGDRTVVETGATVETPYDTFDDAIVLESESAENTINRWYFVEGYGEVKREYIAQEDGEEFKVSSVLESVE